MAEVKEAPRTRAEPPKGKSPATEIEHRPAASPGTWAEHPFAFMHRFAEEMDRLFDDFGLRVPRLVGRGRELLRREAGLIPAEWSPRIDVQRKDGSLVVRVDLPGLSKEDIKVEVADEQLTIRGERKQEEKGEHEGYSYTECSYGSFYRVIPLPEGVDAAKASAEFHNGVLEVAMPAMPAKAPQARRLEVRDKS
ncbi:Spore protein SP21 [Aquisphaera giovannonii]|uniref:Spore protein SP21 n=1 Tax=Aquisphaera giovannonii TaxID=406548 RepID=A0A5B9WGL9_9BACT|nr:Hsp20/alpha crystallin family protein [Aquisphaera giovannonii]QEH38990.1 Spore protein SP21 [Aquisphaera giovannonii]